jgi:hypothetical protein
MYKAVGFVVCADAGQRDVFIEPIYDVAYHLGVAWAEKIFRAWSEMALPMPEAWPFSKEEAVLAVLRLREDADPVMARRLAAITHASARVAWTRLRDQAPASRRRLVSLSPVEPPRIAGGRK